MCQHWGIPRKSTDLLGFLWREEVWRGHLATFTGRISTSFRNERSSYPQLFSCLIWVRCCWGLSGELAAAIATGLYGTTSTNQIHEEDQREKGARSGSQRSWSLCLQASKQNGVQLINFVPLACLARCCIHCIALLSLEHNLTSFQRLVDLTLPKLLFDLFYSEQIDKSSGEAVVLFFANILHSSKQIQAQIMKGADIVTWCIFHQKIDFKHC